MPCPRARKPSLPVAIRVHEQQLEPQEAVEVGVVVPSGFVQEEDVPVGQHEEEATQSVKAAQHDAHGPYGEKRGGREILS